MHPKSFVASLSLLVLIPLALTAQVVRERDEVPLKHWPAPLYWQPTAAETQASMAQPAAGIPLPLAQTPANSLVFVGMTPCRVVDTRATRGFTGAFGPPSLAGGASRTFPIQSSTTCTIPAIAQAYSFSVAVVPPGALGFLTAYPTGQPRPNASTLNSVQGFIVANAAIVAAGTSGSVDVFVSNDTDVVIDINGYFAPQSGITLAQGSAGAPSMSFAGDAGTGVFSSGAGVLNFSTLGTNRLTVRADGDLDLAGNIRKFGTLFLNSNGANSAGVGFGALANSSGGRNNAFGLNALGLTPGNTGQFNNSVGAEANEHNTSGGSNNAFGDSAMQTNSTGSSNTAIGDFALGNMVTGSNNTAIGASAGLGILLSNNIDIGNQGTAADSGVIRIGDVNQNKFFASGVRGVTTGAADAVGVMIDSSGQLGTVNSSRRYKEDIQDMGEASSGLMKLRPVTYRYQQPYADGSKPTDYGLIAEEVEEVYPDMVTHLANGEVETVQYHKINAMLLNEVQKQQRKIAQQEQAIEALKAKLAGMSALESRLAALENAAAAAH